MLDGLLQVVEGAVDRVGDVARQVRAEDGNWCTVSECICGRCPASGRGPGAASLKDCSVKLSSSCTDPVTSSWPARTISKPASAEAVELVQLLRDLARELPDLLHLVLDLLAGLVQLFDPGLGARARPAPAPAAPPARPAARRARRSRARRGRSPRRGPRAGRRARRRRAPRRRAGRPSPAAAPRRPRPSPCTSGAPRPGRLPWEPPLLARSGRQSISSITSRAGLILSMISVTAPM